MCDYISYYNTVNSNFFAYAEIRVRGAIMDEVRAMDWAPRSVRRRSQKLQKAEQQLTGELGRRPERVEIAKFLSIDETVLDRMEQELRSVLLVDSDVLDRAKTGIVPGPSAGLMRRERVCQLSESIDRLPERERQVIALYYLEEMKLKTIGELLGVTESRVCQLHTRALGRLRADLNGVEGFVESLAA